jgi:hypothetical protein
MLLKAGALAVKSHAFAFALCKRSQGMLRWGLMCPDLRLLLCELLDIKPVLKEFLPREPTHQPSWANELMAKYWDTQSLASPGCDDPRNLMSVAGGGAQRILTRTVILRSCTTFSSHPELVITSRLRCSSRGGRAMCTKMHDLPFDCRLLCSNRIITTTDRAKAGQPWGCSAKDQSVQVFALPAGTKI